MVAFARGAGVGGGLGVRALHGPGPGGDTRAILEAGGIGVGLMLVFGRRAVHTDASLGRLFDVVVLVKAAVDQMAPGPSAMALLQALEHRPHQHAIRAAGPHTDIDPDLTLRPGGPLPCVRGPEPAAVPLPRPPTGLA